jgi:hypothetical protein
MWVLRTPSTHKTTHKKLGWGFDAPAPDVRGILAEVGLGGEFFQICSLKIIDGNRIII